MDHSQNITVYHKPLKKIDLINADSIVGCNAINGLFLLSGSDQPMIRTINNVFKLS